MKIIIMAGGRGMRIRSVADIECDCRKPKPGMLLRAARDFSIDLASSWMVGDQENDIKAGRAARCRTALVGQGEFG